MVKLYRVENVDGEGMYRSSAPDLTLSEMQDYDRHPTPNKDTMLRQGVIRLLGLDPYDNFVEYSKWLQFKYGFVSLDQMRAWIYANEWRKALHEKGFYISVYECDEKYFVAGNTQAVVKVDTPMVMIGTISLMDL